MASKRGRKQARRRRSPTRPPAAREKAGSGEHQYRSGVAPTGQLHSMRSSTTKKYEIHSGRRIVSTQYSVSSAQAVVDYVRSYGVKDDEITRLGVDSVSWRGAR